MEIKPGQTIGGFCIDEKIGAGGFASVYKAVNKITDEVVALKIPLEEFVDKFSQESLVGKLKHPHIVRAQGGDLHHDPPYLVLEYVESNLQKKIGQLSRKKSIKVVRGVLEAMIHAEEIGIVHRDLKPSNILLTRDCQPKICDFGLAERIDELDLSFNKTAEKAIGTLDYMAPEIKKGGRPTHQSDIYSFGVVLYELFNHEVPDRILKSTGNKKLDSVIKKCLQSNPDKRYSSFKELKPKLKNALVKKKSKKSPQKKPLSFEEATSEAIKQENSDVKAESVYQEPFYRKFDYKIILSKKAIVTGIIGSLLGGAMITGGILGRMVYLDWKKPREEAKIEEVENVESQPRQKARDWTAYWMNYIKKSNSTPIPSTEELLAEEMKEKGYTNLDEFLRDEEIKKKNYTDVGQYWLNKKKSSFSLRIPWRKDHDSCKYYFSGPGIIDKLSSDLMRQIQTDLGIYITLNESGWAAKELEKLKVVGIENRHNGKRPRIWDDLEKVGSGTPHSLNKKDVAPGYEFFVRHEEKLYLFRFAGISKKENWGNFVTFERREIIKK